MATSLQAHDKPAAGERVHGDPSAHRALAASAGRTSILRLAPLVVSVAGAFLFVASRLDDRWVPEDEGSLGQSAQRVLAGELPHREFADLYTGGLTFLNAGLFGAFGENLIWLRMPLLVLFPAFAACAFWIARRFVAAPVAALIVLLVAGWGLPLYPAAMPSWYLLYFAVFGAACLLRYLDTQNRRWLLVAGVFGGVSIAFKVTGFWYLWAVLLFLVFVEQESRDRSGQGSWSPVRHGAFVAGVTLVPVALAASILKDHPGGAEAYNILLPLIVVAGVVAANEARASGSVSGRARIAAVTRLAAPFLAGVALPLLVFSVPFVVTGAVGDMVSGVFVSPQSRLERIYLSTPHPAYALVALPLVLLLVARRGARAPIRRVFDAAFVVLLVVVVIEAGDTLGYWLIWNAARSGAPLVPIMGALALLLMRRPSEATDRRPVMLLLTLAAFAAVPQFPYAESIYFCYALPLYALAAIAIGKYARVDRGVLPVVLLTTFVAFGFIGLDRSPQSLGRHYQGPKPSVVLEASRASIRVPPSDRAMYGRIVRLLREHSAGPYTYAGPDTPEVYYLADLRNPTRALFDFLDDSGSARGGRLLRTLRDRAVTAIAIDLRPAHSDPHEPAILAALRARYPNARHVGRIEVRWS